MQLNKRKKREETKTFDWRLIPQCKHKIKTRLPSGADIYLCRIKKGSGRFNQYCTHVGLENKCRFYASKHKWGRNIYEMAGDLI
jgi:hypothetical protein